MFSLRALDLICAIKTIRKQQLHALLAECIRLQDIENIHLSDYLGYCIHFISRVLFCEDLDHIMYTLNKG